MLLVLIFKRYQNGGAASGFSHFEKKIVNRLYIVKGKRNVRLIELSSIDWSLMNRSDAFIIDLNTVIFVWNGKNSNKIERIQVKSQMVVLLFQFIKVYFDRR